MDTNESFALILASLSAFFALVSILFTAAISFFIWYLTKLSSDRKKEVREILRLQSEFERKLIEFDGKNNSLDLEKLKSEFNTLKQHVISNLYPSQQQVQYKPICNTTTVEDLQNMINDLVLQINNLQSQNSR